MKKEMQVRVASLSGAVAVGLGAFGAHGLKQVLESHQTAEVWETAVFYHFVHTLVLLWISDKASMGEGPRRCFLFGMLVFSGTLYALSVTGIRWLGAITPIGGLALIMGWGWMAVWSARGRDSAGTEV
ncbi:MAG: DUF423 domain-containing protein [Verrucomicrobia bacterium]|nr:DUF423 domain-containing protein [Verrucomicrobiota bacterium]MBT6379265.1 DUF423 domain-containing protein [Opitutales bacterium]